jgi:tRNA (guanine-N7-)-methyltransferase
MSRSLKYDLPGVDWRLGIDEAALRDWSAIFAGDVASPLSLVVEIGFGRGEFLLDLAASAPGTAFVGVEYSFKRTLKLARRLARTPLRNVRLVEAAAEDLVRDALPDAGVSRFWINFPDPWPKKRHGKRRLIQPAFVALLARRLALGGRLDVATDHADYAGWIHEVLSAEPLLENSYAPGPFRRSVDDRKPTAYELEWRALGRDFHFFRYSRVDSG